MWKSYSKILQKAVRNVVNFIHNSKIYEGLPSLRPLPRAKIPLARAALLLFEVRRGEKP